MVNNLESIVNKDEKILCCILGDIVEKGDWSIYEYAYQILEEFFLKLEKFYGKENIEFEIIPGNHDLCLSSFECFNKFATKLLNREVNYSDINPIKILDKFSYKFIFACSVKNNIIDYGQINFDMLSSYLDSNRTIVFTHHSLVSGDESDGAAIRNGYELHKLLENNNIIALLHGHTHGYKRYTVGNKCQIIGVGPFLKEEKSISNQCNLLKIEGNHIKKITTLLYQDDRKNWDNTVTYERTNNYYYYGTSIKKVYDQLLNDAEERSLLNLQIKVKQEFEKIDQELKLNFKSCIELAEIWQNDYCPQTLPYTHGQLMNYNNKNWEEHIVEILKKNPTSKRAIIPLIDKEMAYRGGDGELVSFDIVQFGFENSDCKDLHITVYLRALEMRYFLPLNICEVFLMANKIKKRIQSISNLTICFFAFKAEAKKNYGCYKKSKIDLITESEICKMIANKEFSKFKQLLNEKASMGDSVIDLMWIEKLERVFNVFCDFKNAEQVINQLASVKNKLEILKEARMYCSDYSNTQIQENDFVEALKVMIDLVEE